MKLNVFGGTEIEKAYAKGIDEYCTALNLDYDITKSSFGYNIKIMSKYGETIIYANKETCLDEFAKFLYGFNFGKEITCKKHDIY